MDKEIIKNCDTCKRTGVSCSRWCIDFCEWEPKKEYIKPEYKKEKLMMFMMDGIKKYRNNPQMCRQCCSCHGCR